MSRNDDARRQILRSIREHLAASAPHDVVHAERHQPGPPPTASAGIALPILPPPGARASEPSFEGQSGPEGRFRERLEAVGGVLVRVGSEQEAAGAVARILSEIGARRVAFSDSPLVRRVVDGMEVAPDVELFADATTADLFDCDVGVSGAQWGVAETGSLVLESARERTRLVSLVPPVHLALLRSEHICETLGEALARVAERAEEGGLASRAITFITGPSRTSDIELTLTIGVHGPQALYVVLLSDPANSHPSKGRPS